MNFLYNKDLVCSWTFCLSIWSQQIKLKTIHINFLRHVYRLPSYVVHYWSEKESFHSKQTNGPFSMVKRCRWLKPRWQWTKSWLVQCTQSSLIGAVHTQCTHSAPTQSISHTLVPTTRPGVTPIETIYILQQRKNNTMVWLAVKGFKGLEVCQQ